MKYLIFIICSITLIRCNIASKEKEYKFYEIGWTIKVPLYFDIIDSMQAKEEDVEGKGIIEKNTVNVKFTNTSKRLLYFRKGNANELSCTIRHYDTIKEGSYAEHIQLVRNTLYNAFKQALEANATIDTSSSKEKIDNIRFDRFQIKIIRSSAKDLTSYFYSRSISGYSVAIVVSYENEKIGEKIISVLNSSKFVQ